jgi:hypothetical protein
MVLDRDRFLFFVAAMSAPACKTGGSDREATAFAPIVVASIEPVATESRPPAAPRPPTEARVEDAGADEPVAAPVVSECEKQNDTGTVDCTKMKQRRFSGPACEGVGGTCDLLEKGYAYRPRAAQAAAACIDRLGARACDIGARKKCYEEGIKASCPEPRFEAQCEAKIAQCQAAKVRVQYTKEECVKSMSAQKDRDRAWALSQMGPSSEGKCRLMFTVF